MIKWQTEKPVKLEDLTQSQINQFCNGCGGKGGWIKPPHRIFFKASCNHHDYGYFKGCNRQHRKRADKKLYDAMMEDCRTLPEDQEIMYKPWCLLYYLAVRIMGWKFFYYADRQRWPVE